MLSDKDLCLLGAKVFLKFFKDSDISEEYIGWLNDPEVVKYSNQRFLKHDKKSCLLYLTSFEGTENLFFGVYRSSDQKMIGTLTAYKARHHGTVDVGIMIGDKSIWGQGYGQDAWDTLTNWLISCESIRKLTAGTLACNLGMIRLMERSGMNLEAVKKAQELVEGLPEDILYFARFRET